MPISIRLFFSCFFLLGIFHPASFGQSPFGVDLPSSPLAGQDSGIWGDALRFIAAWQSAFYQALTRTIDEMKADGRALWFLIGLSFLYGVLHAAGPGHGKVVMSSYVLANQETARRGALLCLLSSLLQAFMAVLIIGLLRIALNATSFAISDTVRFLEAGSYALIMGLGLYLLWRTLKPLLKNASKALLPQLQTVPAQADCGCGHAHAPTAAQAAQKDVRAAVAAVVSVGLRPCSGALIVLSFALAQGLFWAGVLSVFAMGLGTALTVMSLMYLAVSARGLGLAAAKGRTGWTHSVLSIVQLAGALFVFLFGLTLLSASLQRFF